MLDSNNITTHASVNRTFWETLEWRLGAAFAQAADKRLHGLWCDGILDPLVDTESIAQVVRHQRRLSVIASMGYDGQDPYAMTVWFGPKAQGRVARGLSLDRCIPASDTMDWITLDQENKTVEVQLH